MHTKYLPQNTFSFMCEFPQIDVTLFHTFRIMTFKFYIAVEFPQYKTFQYPHKSYSIRRMQRLHLLTANYSFKHCVRRISIKSKESNSTSTLWVSNFTKSLARKDISLQHKLINLVKIHVKYDIILLKSVHSKKYSLVLLSQWLLSFNSLGYNQIFP